jgi:hypothetical protein
VKLCSACIQKTKPSAKARLAKESHLEAWKKTRIVTIPVAPVIKKSLEDMSMEELNAEIAKLS